MISKKEVEHIAKLARLELSGKETTKMQKEFADILAFVAKLNEADVSKVRPTSHPLALENVMREDRANPEDTSTKKEMLSQAPEREGDFIKVKEVLS